MFKTRERDTFPLQKNKLIHAFHHLPYPTPDTDIYPTLSLLLFWEFFFFFPGDREKARRRFVRWHRWRSLTGKSLTAIRNCLVSVLFGRAEQQIRLLLLHRILTILTTATAVTGTWRLRIALNLHHLQELCLLLPDLFSLLGVDSASTLPITSTFRVCQLNLVHAMTFLLWSTWIIFAIIFIFVHIDCYLKY